MTPRFHIGDFVPAEFTDERPVCAEPITVHVHYQHRVIDRLQIGDRIRLANQPIASVHPLRKAFR